MLFIVKEIDDFLRRWVTPALAPRGYRKASHTFRKRFEGGDWGAFSFRSYPLSGTRGSLIATATFIPDPLHDWFNFTHPDLATKLPNTEWSYWGGSRVTNLHGGDWQYETDAERDICGGMLVERLHGVADLLDRFGSEPEFLVAEAWKEELQPFDDLPGFHHHLRHPAWRVALLIRRGPSPELAQALDEADAAPYFHLREWAGYYVTAL
jgi:hypothetical protein